MKILISRSLTLFKDFYEHFRLGGPLVSLEFIWNKRITWNIADFQEFNDIENRGTSLSDTSAYVQICNLASENDEILKRFKSEINYMRILEHVDYPLGRSYLSKFADNFDLMNNLRTVSSLEVGKPRRYHFPKLGYMSPTQLRYTKILGELSDLFGSLDSFSIAEIGVGNGGQSFHILNMYDLSSYTYFDLPEVQKLVRRILEINKVEVNASFPDIFKLVPGSYDLVIANYSFSELREVDQRDYLDKVILNSKRGYMILNNIKPHDHETVSSSELLSMIPGSQILPEDPISHPDNQLLVWGHKRAT